MRDRNFDDIAEKFSRNIYGTTKGQLRQTILWQDLDAILATYGGQTLRVLDAGGGEGQTAIKWLSAVITSHFAIFLLRWLRVPRVQQRRKV